MLVGMSTLATELGTLLTVWAHPDDETYLVGGLMAAARDIGQRVVCATATAGELGTPDPAAWPPDRLARVRRWEASAAMAVLGVDEHEIVGMPDGGLADLDEQGVAWACALLDRVRPDTICTFGPDGGTFHPDHIAVHRWVTAAWEAQGRPGRLLYAAMTTEHLAQFGERYEQWNVFMTDERPAAVPERDLAVRLVLDGPELDRKLTALRAMATQTTDLATALGPQLYNEMIREEAFVAA
jgi:LmbE family N-acetylglucosaminyl deacetylase